METKPPDYEIKTYGQQIPKRVPLKVKLLMRGLNGRMKLVRSLILHKLERKQARRLAEKVTTRPYSWMQPA